MIGTWIVDTYDGVRLNERNFTVLSFNAHNEVIYRGEETVGDGNFKWGENTLSYNIYCCDFSIYGMYNGLFGFDSNVSTQQKYDFVSVKDSLVTIRNLLYVIGQEEVTPEYSTMTMRKIPNTYAKADSLYGIWQFKTKNGDDFSDYRIQFKNNECLVFYMRDENNAWMIPSNQDKYQKYHDFLVLTLFDNSVFGKAGLTDICCFTIESLSPSAGILNMSSGGDKYTLSYVSSN